uniref:uncharacterized protein LOC120341938 n=1 Tax=Styela clava TaxID=7725 RepID=UPI001939F9DC|nr:uncharacterized protein LOC120341938 [Styela clava]
MGQRQTIVCLSSSVDPEKDNSLGTPVDPPKFLHMINGDPTPEETAKGAKTSYQKKKTVRNTKCKPRIRGQYGYRMPPRSQGQRSSTVIPVKHNLKLWGTFGCHVKPRSGGVVAMTSAESCRELRCTRMTDFDHRMTAG